MKRPRPTGDHPHKTRKLKQRARTNRDEQLNELLKMCLQKVCELQAELESTEQRDPEAAGYAVCAIETLSFLSNEGLPPNHPMVQALTDKLMGDKDKT